MLQTSSTTTSLLTGSVVVAGMVTPLVQSAGATRSVVMLTSTGP